MIISLTTVSSTGPQLSVLLTFICDGESERSTVTLAHQDPLALVEGRVWSEGRGLDRGEAGRVVLVGVPGVVHRQQKRHCDHLLGTWSTHTHTQLYMHTCSTEH